jgi:hypothetical protein
MGRNRGITSPATNLGGRTPRRSTQAAATPDARHSGAPEQPELHQPPREAPPRTAQTGERPGRDGAGGVHTRDRSLVAGGDRGGTVDGFAFGDGQRHAALIILLFAPCPTATATFRIRCAHPEPMTPLLSQLCLLATRVNTLEHAADPHVNPLESWTAPLSGLSLQCPSR